MIKRVCDICGKDLDPLKDTNRFRVIIDGPNGYALTLEISANIESHGTWSKADIHPGCLAANLAGLRNV